MDSRFLVFSCIILFTIPTYKCWFFRYKLPPAESGPCRHNASIENGHILVIKCLPVYCDRYPQPGNNGRLSITNGTNLDSVATVTCHGNYYPSNQGNMPGHTPTTRHKSSTCKLRKDGKTPYWDNGILKCVLVTCKGRTPKDGWARYIGPQTLGGGYLVGTVVTYQCKRKAKSGLLVQNCKENGQWSGHLPNCEADPCFPSKTEIKLENGKIVKMSELQIGGKVQTVTSTGSVKYSEVRIFMEKKHNAAMKYLSITTFCNKTLTLSPNHLVFARKGCNDEFSPIYADQVFVGSEVLIERNDEVVPAKVIDVSSLLLQGAYVPLTNEGNIIVDEVLASCHASVDHHLAHLTTTPIRWFPNIIQMIFGKEEGISAFIKISEELGIWMLPYMQLF